MCSRNFTISAEDISENDYENLSQASNQSQFKFEEDSDSNYEDDSDYLPSSQDSSSQEFSQVGGIDIIANIWQDIIIRNACVMFYSFQCLYNYAMSLAMLCS